MDYIVETVNFFSLLGQQRMFTTVECTAARTAGHRNEVNHYSHCFMIVISSYRTISGVYRLLIEQPQVQKRYEDLNAYPDYSDPHFRNGMFDVKAQKMLKHSPQYFAINQVPHDFRIDLQGTS